MHATTAERRHSLACGSYWLVAQTHPQAEQWAARNLTNGGYQPYVPTLIVQRRDRHTPTILHRIVRPLFTSYLFVHMHNTDHWAPIAYFTGIRRILMSGSKPHHTPHSLIDALRAGDAMRRLPTTDSVVYRPGAPATCLYGPLKGADVVIISAATNTAKVAAAMFGAMREITVPIQCLAVRE